MEHLFKKTEGYDPVKYEYMIGRDGYELPEGEKSWSIWDGRVYRRPRVVKSVSVPMRWKSSKGRSGFMVDDAEGLFNGAGLICAEYMRKLWPQVGTYKGYLKISKLPSEGAVRVVSVEDKAWNSDRDCRVELPEETTVRITNGLSRYIKQVETPCYINVEKTK